MTLEDEVIECSSVVGMEDTAGGGIGNTRPELGLVSNDEIFFLDDTPTNRGKVFMAGAREDESLPNGRTSSPCDSKQCGSAGSSTSSATCEQSGHRNGENDQTPVESTRTQRQSVRKTTLRNCPKRATFVEKYKRRFMRSMKTKENLVGAPFLGAASIDGSTPGQQVRGVSAARVESSSDDKSDLIQFALEDCAARNERKNWERKNRNVGRLKEVISQIGRKLVGSR